MSAKIPCSVLILTLNCAESLKRCLKNLSPFGEILVHDGNSEDNTREVAERSGARVLKQYETDEPNVRVKDFTEIRLKQRRDARYDWVLYLDADEYLSDALVEEIGHILEHAHEKVIVHVPRLPVVEGKIIQHGAFWPEVVPRIHHRKGGCTLQKGRTVHEKYVYDDSFEVVRTQEPLYVPMDSLQKLLKKDNSYIYLEMERLRCAGGYRWSQYIKWFLFREPITMVYILLRIFLNRLRYGFRSVLPMGYELRAVRYHWKLFTAMTGFMFSHTAPR